MLREYRLTNFKAFGETVTIPVRPLTLIFGANSSGKSSIFQSLLLLKQTLEEARNPDIPLLPKGSLVDLGPYNDFVHRHDTDRNFEFEVRFDSRDQEELVKRILKSAGATNVGLGVKFSYDEKKQAATLDRLNIVLGDETSPPISYAPCKPSDEAKAEATIQIEVHSETECWRQLWNLVGEEKPEGVIQQALKGYQLKDKKLTALYHCKEKRIFVNFLQIGEIIRSESDFGRFTSFELGEDRIVDETILQGFGRVSLTTQHICSSFRRLMEDLVHLGPLRSYPNRYYSFSGDRTNYVGQTGEDLPSILFERPELLGEINSDLEKLKVKYKLELSKLQYEDSDPSNVFSLYLVDTRAGIDASMRDVGFGISQVLPIILQSRLSEKETILIEQPEIHLHPAHQAELGDMFIRSAKERGNTLLLETHSEHLLLRIMRRMRETSTGKLPEGAIAVRPEDVMVLFVESDGSQSIVREMPLDERGELVKAWPGGFFEEGLREIL